MKLLAAGSNSHRQLNATDNDVRIFESIPTESKTEVLYASWSTTTMIAGSQAITIGFRPWATEFAFLKSDTKLQSAFGDHDGLLGCLDTAGCVYILRQPNAQGLSLRTSTLELLGDNDDAPKIAHFALASNGKVALSFKQAPNGRLTHIVEFASLSNFQEWFLDPSDASNAPAAHHMLPGQAAQLLANSATFLLRMESGEVYTWGDPRYQTLARSIVGEDAVPAHEPGIVNALGGLAVSKVACGGWLGAALCDQALYIWGSTLPGKDGEIKILAGTGADAVELVDNPSDQPGSESVDFVDVAVGNNHIAAVSSDGRLFVVGDNGNGQLGLDSEKAFCDDWVEVLALEGVRQVVCGPQSTFLWSDETL